MEAAKTLEVDLNEEEIDYIIFRVFAETYDIRKLSIDAFLEIFIDQAEEEIQDYENNEEDDLEYLEDEEEAEDQRRNDLEEDSAKFSPKYNMEPLQEEDDEDYFSPMGGKKWKLDRRVGDSRWSALDSQNEPSKDQSSRYTNRSRDNKLEVTNLNSATL